MAEYVPDTGALICAEIAEGKSLAAVCRENEINYRHVFDWLANNKQFADNYARAREAQADYHADEIIGIADTEEDPNKARVRIDARKWVAGKMKPKKYGDSTQIKHADANGDKLSFCDILRELDGRTAGLPGSEKEPE